MRQKFHEYVQVEPSIFTILLISAFWVTILQSFFHKTWLSRNVVQQK